MKNIKDIIGVDKERVTTRAFARRLRDKHSTEVPSPTAYVGRDSLARLLNEC